MDPEMALMGGKIRFNKVSSGRNISILDVFSLDPPQKIRNISEGLILLYMQGKKRSPCYSLGLMGKYRSPQGTKGMGN